MKMNVSNKLATRTKKPEHTSLIYGKMAPQAPDLETAVLGAMMLEPKKCEQVLTILQSEDFYSDANQRIYNSICRLFMAGKLRIDFMIVCEDLRANSELEMVGGNYYVTGLMRDVVSTAHVEEHAMIVKQKSLLRSAIRIFGQGIGDAYENNCDCFELISRVGLELAELENGIRSKSVQQLGDVMIDAMNEMVVNGENESDMIGIPTGFKDLDRITLGLTAPDLIIVAGGPGEGKSTFALQLCNNMARNLIPVAFFSLEMKNKQLIWKMFSSELNVDIKTIRRGKLKTDQWDILNETAHNANKIPFYLYDQQSLSIYEFRSICRSLKAKYNIGAVYVDYLQLLTTEGGDKQFGLREMEVNFISKQLKACAKELDIPVIALSQLNQNAVREKRPYELGDLRESGAIQQDADGVIFIWRPLYHGILKYAMNKRDDIYFTDGDALGLIKKWRLGETGHFRMTFVGYANKFTEYDPLPFLSGPAMLPPEKLPRNTSQPNEIKFDEHTKTVDIQDDDMPF